MQDKNIFLPKYDRLPEWKEILEYNQSLNKKTSAQLLAEADIEGRLLVQPRCGVGDHVKMKELLSKLEDQAAPDILSLTIDSYTRLCRFDQATHLLKFNPAGLNGYPLVSHGYRKGRELNESIRAPLEIRHGTPHANLLFDISIASGITSFEGGGICYNLPYCNKTPISQTIENWKYVDRLTGQLADEGIIVDRELFGTLTAVLMPPSISLSMTLLEAILASNEGVKCISVAYCQSGNLAQDIAALRIIREVFPLYLEKDVKIYPVLHAFMGAFPENRRDAEAVILLSGITAHLGNATKIINKTYDEAFGIPTIKANIDGILTTKASVSSVLNTANVDEKLINEEMKIIRRELLEIVTPVVETNNITNLIIEKFNDGQLDIPFSASRYAKSAITPLRDENGAIRIWECGNLPLGRESMQENKNLLESVTRKKTFDVFEKLKSDIFYFKNHSNKNLIEREKK